MSKRTMKRPTSRIRPVPAGPHVGITPPEEVPEGEGLGDLVHRVAHPVAIALDALLGTDLVNCGGCSRRRSKLNRFGRRLARALRRT